jgi:glycosyltransferase involved in cell wall biosynthesis
VNVLIVTDTYPPLRTSGAQQIYDLGQAFIQEHHQVTIVTPELNQTQSIDIQTQEGAQVVRVKCFQTKDVNYFRRTFAELINPFVIWSHLKSSQIMNQKIDGVIWYSPSIFWGPLVKRLKAHYQCKSYLILRDIFPDWVRDLGLIKNGPVFWFLKAVEKFQYQQADRIGVQTPNSLTYFVDQHPNLKDKCEVLWIWIGEAKAKPCSIDLSQTPLKGRSIFVYAGNMGVAQNMDCLIDLASELKDRQDIGFVFVGRGSEVARLRRRVANESLANTLFFDEIDADEIPDLYNQCQAGILTLDPRHTAHNIPGKLLTYLRSGMPVLAVVNPGNDLLTLLPSEKVGVAIDNNQKDQILKGFMKLEALIKAKEGVSERCQNLSLSLFSAKGAANQITSFFNSPNKYRIG